MCMSRHTCMPSSEWRQSAHSVSDACVYGADVSQVSGYRRNDVGKQQTNNNFHYTFGVALVSSHFLWLNPKRGKVEQFDPMAYSFYSYHVMCKIKLNVRTKSTVRVFNVMDGCLRFVVLEYIIAILADSHSCEHFLFCFAGRGRFLWDVFFFSFKVRFHGQSNGGLETVQR